MIRRAFAAIVAFVLWASPALAATCRDVTFEGNSYSICEASLEDDLRLWLRGDDGNVLGSFSAVEEGLGGSKLAFAMNAGMYHEDRRPVGLYLEHGRQEGILSDGGGYGNFGLLPNGVFCIGETYRVWETKAFRAARPTCEYATQSGPMLVIDGALHPRFEADSTSRYIRNGVGTSADGTRAVFAISNRPVNFYNFASLFRDYLGLPNALFLDGNVSRLYAPEIGRADRGRALGPIVGVVAPVDWPGPAL